uniref:Phospholipase A1 n=1 Tax=Davidia involucrata TaxID=16924 RepID=A0A5B7BI42_DAVIN
MATNEPTWEELLGSKEWEGLLDPLELSLRKLILRCGEFIGATGDAFNNVTNSKYIGSCRYGMQSLFNKVYLPSAASDYQVVAYLYTSATIFEAAPPGAGGWDNGQSNWMGYIAVTTDDVSKANGRREIYIAWRGTILLEELKGDFDYTLVSANPLLASEDEDAKVSEGWLKFYTTDNPDSVFAKTSPRTQLQTKIKELLNQYKDEALSLLFTGHSLGAALAALSAFDVVENNVITTNIPVAAFVLAMPMLGNDAFCKKIKALLPILHVRNIHDIVPSFPGFLNNEYATVGTELVVDTTKSPYLKTPQKNRRIS